MKDLIIIIIAITLSAVVGGASMYYGGNAYMGSQANANANKYINYLDQVMGVLNLWSQRNGGALPRPSTGFPSACTNTAYCSVTDLQTMMGTRYVGIAGAPDGTDASELLYWNEATTANLTQNNPVLLLRLGTNTLAKNSCTAVETMRQGGTAPTALRVYNGGTVNINDYMCGNYGCFQNDGTFGAVGTYLYIVYARARQMPSTSLTDYTGPTCPTT